MADDFYELSLGGTYTGPLDLLCLLMQKEEIPFEKIYIAEIVEQYLEYIRDLENIDLSYAGDFLSLASRLMLLKAKSLLPNETGNEEELLDFEIERAALLAQMEEYQKFKRVAMDLQTFESNNFGTYGRGRPEKIGKDDRMADYDVWQLLKAFHRSMQTHVYSAIHTIEIDNIDIKDREQHISNYLSEKGRALFEDLLGRDRFPLMSAVTFSALLELTKNENIVFRQGETLGPLWVYRKKQNDEYKEELAGEKIYYSKEPDFTGGLLEVVRNRSLAQELEERTSLDSVLRLSMNLATTGRALEENDIELLLNGEELC